MYIDSSALLKLYLDEPESDEALALVEAAGEPATARVALVEVRRRLVLEFEGAQLDAVRKEFHRGWEMLRVMEIDAGVCERAAVIAERTGLRSLDALHLGAADPLREAVPFLTYDVRQANAARALGWTVLGA